MNRPPLPQRGRTCLAILVLVWLHGLAQAQLSPQWSVVRQGPATETFAAVVDIGSSFVAVGGAGQINIISSDGQNWLVAQVTANNFQSVAWSGSLLLAASPGSLDSTSLWSSPDSLTWSPVKGDFPGQMTFVTWTGTQWAGTVVSPLPNGGDSLSIVTSQDGSHWTLLGTLPDAGAGLYHNVRGLVWTGQTFVLAGATSFFSPVGWIAATADGVTWENHSYPSNKGFASAVWTGTQVVVGGSTEKAVYTSATGLGGWAAHPLAQVCDSLLWTGTQIVALGTYYNQSSADAQAWQVFTLNTPRAQPTFASVWKSDHGFGVGGGGFAYTWTDLTTYHVASPTGPGLTSDLYAAAASSDKLVSVGAKGMAQTGFYGPGIAADPGGNSLYGVTWTGSQFVAVGAAATVVASSTGATWQPMGTGSFAGETFNAIAGSGNNLVAVGLDTSLGQTGVIYSSTDGGSTWARRNVPASVVELDDVTLHGSLWVAVGSSNTLAGVVLTSADGITWTMRPLPAGTGCLTGVASNGTTLVAAGASLLTSANGTTWTMRQDETTWTKAGWTGHAFLVLSASGGNAATSPDGITWTPRFLNTINRLHGITQFEGNAVVVGANGIAVVNDNLPAATLTQTAQDSLGTSTVTVTVRLSFATDTPVTVPLVIGGDATSDLYSGIPSSVTFAPGETSHTFVVTVGGYQGVHSDETLTISLGYGTQASVPPGTAATSITIVNPYNPPPVSFVQPSLTAGENAGTIGVAVDLGWAPASPVTVPITVSGSAKAGVFSGVPDTLTFPAGVSSQTIPLAIVPDTSIVGSRTVVLTLGSPTNATLGAQATFTLIIQDQHSHYALTPPWTLRNPLPSGEGFESIVTFGTATGTRAVVVGGDGLILTSDDNGSTWVRRFSGTTANLHAVQGSLGQVIAVGDHGQIVLSTDGLTWTSRGIPGADKVRLTSLAMNGNNLLVTCGWSTDDEKPVAYTSQDGQFWAPQSLPATTGRAASIAWWGSQFVIVGAAYGTNSQTGLSVAQKNLVLRSSDGYVWTDQSSTTTVAAQGGFKNVIIAGHQAIAFDGTTTAWFSTDGTAWTAHKLGAVAAANGVANSNGQVLAFGGAGIAVSTDGIKWTPQTTPAKSPLLAGVWSGTSYWAITSSAVFTSPYPLSWALHSSGVDSGGAPVNGVIWSGTQFVAVGGTASGPALVMTSPNGSAWTQRSTGVNSALGGVAWSGTTYAAVGTGGVILTSANGITWTKRASGVALDLHAITWDDRQFVAVGGNAVSEDYPGQPPGSVVLTSPNGITWTRRAIPTTYPLEGVASSGNLLVATGRHGEVLTSNDGIAWMHRSINAGGANLHSVASSGSLFVTASDANAIFSSADGITWNGSAPLPASYSAIGSKAGAVWTGSQFVIAGASGSLLTSPDADVWTALVNSTQQALQGLAWNGSTLVAAGNNALILTSDSGTGTPVPVVQFAATSTTVSEAAGSAQLLVQLSLPAPAGFKLPYTIGGVQAVPLAFNAGETTRLITVPVKNNVIADGSHNLAITLGSPVPASACTLGANVNETITITDDDTAPTCTHPGHQLLIAGGSLRLTTIGSGSGTLTYQWKKNGVAIAGATLATYYVPASTFATAGTYTVTVKNSVGSFTSANTEVGVFDGGSYHYAPAVGGKQVLVQKAAGNGLSFKWTRDYGATFVSDFPGRISGSATGTLSLSNLVAPDDSGVWEGVVTQVASNLQFDAARYSLAVASARPVIATTFLLPVGAVGKYYDFTSPLLDPSSPPATSITASGLPAGLYLNPATGEIMGIPTKPVTSQTVTFSATNAMGTSASHKSAITITGLPAGFIGSWDGITQSRGTFDGGLGARVGLTISSTGSFTGKATIGTAVSTFVGGQLWVDGPWATGSVDLVQPGNRILRFTFRLDPTAFNITGTLSLVTPAGDVVETLNTVLVRAKTADAPKFKGIYSFALDLDPALAGNAAIPQGSGYGTINIGTAGTYTLSGRLADGSSFTCSSFVGGINDTPGQLLIYCPLYNGKGSLHGGCDVQFGGADPAYADSTVTPLSSINTTWFKPADPSAAGARTYPAGWSPAKLAINGSKYNAPAKNVAVMALGSTIPNSQLHFIGGGADVAALSPDEALYIRGNGQILSSSVNPANTTISITSSTGAFSGKFTLDDILADGSTCTRTGTYQGQIVRFINGTPAVTTYRGAGWFMLPQLPPANVSPVPSTASTPILSGQVSLVPSP